jgi:hypothetical protein
MDNEAVNRVRIEAYKKHGDTRVVRLRVTEGKIRFYICSVRGRDILSVLASGETEREIMSQL